MTTYADTFATLDEPAYALHGADHSRILTIVLMSRWGNVGILTDGVEWYSAILTVDDNEALLVAEAVNAYADKAEAIRDGLKR